jgi:uncharacterized coiled-coil DUF342 family protein
MLLVLLMGFGLVVHLSEFRSLRSETTRLAMESEQRRREMDWLLEEVTLLRRERDVLLSKADRLRREKLGLRYQYEVLSSIAAEFRTKADLLRVERDELLNKVDRFRTKVTELLTAPSLFSRTRLFLGQMISS